MCKKAAASQWPCPGGCPIQRKTKGVENSGEGKTYNKTPPQKRFWTPPPLYDMSPPVSSRPVIFLRGNGHRPDKSHILGPPKLGLEGVLYSTFPPHRTMHFAPICSTKSVIVTPPFLCAPNASKSYDLRAVSPRTSRQSTGKMTNRPLLTMYRAENAQRAQRGILMPRGKNCRETIFAAQLPRNYPHRGGNFERGKNVLYCGGEAICEAF